MSASSIRVVVMRVCDCVFEDFVQEQIFSERYFGVVWVLERFGCGYCVQVSAESVLALDCAACARASDNDFFGVDQVV